jgi:hypothetical protein
MLKLVAVGIVGILSAFGGAAFALMQSMVDASGEVAVAEEQIENVSTELTAVPIISQGKVTGYLVMRLSSKVDRAQLPNSEETLTPLLSDAAFRAAFDFAARGVTEIKAKHVEEFSAEVMRLANKRFGKDIVKEVNLEQFNLLSSSQIRGNGVRPN